MKVLITGTARGIGKKTAEKFLEYGHNVIGLDILESAISHSNYTHFVSDVRSDLPEVPDVEILITCAGVQLPEEDAIAVNLTGTIRTVEKYATQPKIRSVLTLGSASGINGAEFPLYSASKGGVIAYTKNVALRIAGFGATANCLCPGGVYTDSNAPVLNDAKLREEVMKENLFGRWAEEEEIADWIYFLTVLNKSMTGQELLIDNGEMLKSNFVWPK